MNETRFQSAVSNARPRGVCGIGRSVGIPDKPTQLFLDFRDECQQFEENLGGKSLTIQLSLERILQHRGGNILLSKLTQAQRPDHYLKVYCWGSIEPRERRPGYLVEIASLNNLVLKRVAKKASSRNGAAAD